MKQNNIAMLISILVFSSLVGACSEPPANKLTPEESKAEVAKILSGDGPQAPQAQQANAQSNQQSNQ